MIDIVVPIVLFCFIVVTILIISIKIYNIEKKAWNNGRCSCNRGMWKIDKTLSEGYAVFKCSSSKCNNTIILYYLKRKLKNF